MRKSSNYRLLRNALVLALATATLPTTAGTLEQAKRIHDRLAGVPPDDSAPNHVLSTMQAKLATGVPSDAIDAAYIAMSNRAFYNATLKNWATPWTNRDGNKFAPLNDYTATVIGIVRDELDYRQVLFGNIIYVPNSSYGAYSNSNNVAYAALEAADGDMGSGSQLEKKDQSAVTGLPPSATAGVATTRAAARAFFIDGTNRAMFRFTLKNHLCHDMEDVQDTTRPTDRIRRDVSRSPGGDSRVFMNTCVGCHSGMDPMAQAFAYYNFSYTKGNEDGGFLTYRAASDTAHDPNDLTKSATPGGTESKYHINENHFPEGYETLNDNWNNYWRVGPNTAIFGWDSGLTGSGSGAQSMLHELANSEAFAVCSVKKVFKAVCLRDPADPVDSSAFGGMLTHFQQTHNLKYTFAQAAVYCSGQ